MKSALILGLAAQAIAGVVPPREPVVEVPVTRSFDLPPVTIPTDIPHPIKRDTLDLGDVVVVTPDPDQVQIVGLTYGGTGCPSGSVSHVLSDDRSVMTLIFDQYVAAFGPDYPVAEARKNCQLNINLRYPGGFQYSVFSADYRGYAYLEEGVSGTQKSTYYFSGQPVQTSTETNWTGPYDADYFIHDEAPSTSTVWSPCGGNGLLNINSQLRLSGDRTKAGLLTNDSIDGSFVQVVHVRWQECTPE
ncbi:hypothetical protein AJ80_03743 [Polytolypa hystricis UAMH7299]|uniref:Secreted protein n=1 Tax=Polytolypa hystricis (strain UAMH7299) TaxID=1447883 RepID=A0A2B7YE63_POLH7|nr:hypothetical protein AJ80_03743 [Polytolypa hystricis UAMH7299]